MFIKCLLLLFFLGFIEGGYPYRRSDAPCPYQSLLHGRVRMRQRMKFAEYRCASRYTMVGHKYSTCMDGQWDVPKPVCVRPGCSDLPEMKNGIAFTSTEGAWVNFFCLPGYRLEGSPSTYCDGKVWNTTVPQCIASLQAQPQTSCDFEDERICGWRQDLLHDFDWMRFNRETPSSLFMTGPSHDHTYGANGTGYYMYIESTGRMTNSSARLLSPVYDAKLASDGCFVFYYHMFGRSTGGLRVYQKPDSINLGSLRFADVRQKYLLFEKWGEQGNQWYDSVTPLQDFEEDFQIVIEGIRGDMFTSDIAIDDVAILQGENCTLAKKTATTPEPTNVDSCEGRCEGTEVYPGRYNCGCNVICLVYHNCCPDFLDICEYGNNSSVTDDPIPDSTPVELPQTQKLVANHTLTTFTSPATTTTSPTTPKPTTTSTTTTPRPTTTSTTTSRRTTIKTKTTRKLTTSTTSTPLTKATRTTSKSPTTSKTTPKVTKGYTTTKRTTQTSKTTTTYSPTKVTETTARTSSLRPNTNKDSTDINDTKARSANSGGSESHATAIVIAVIVVCAALLLVGVAATHARRSAVIARLRGRIHGESEVRYLTRAEDD